MRRSVEPEHIPLGNDILTDRGKHRLDIVNVVDFIDVAMVQQEKLGLEIEEIMIEPSSPFAGQTVSGSKIRQDLGIIVLAIKRPGEPMHYNPASNDKIEAGDYLIVMGPPEQLRRMEGIAGARA